MAEPQIPLAYTSYNPSYVVNRSQYEQAIYVEIVGDTRFPAITSTIVTDNAWPDNTQAYIPSDVKLGTQPLANSFWTPSNPPPALTANTVYPKFATLNYVVNAEDFITAQNGLSAVATGNSAYGVFQGIQAIVSGTTITAVTAINSNLTSLLSISLPVGQIIYGPFTGVTVGGSGGVLLVLNA